MFSSPGANSLHDALDDDAAADLTGQMQVEQEGRATTSEGRLRAEDTAARDQDGDQVFEEAPPVEQTSGADVIVEGNIYAGTCTKVTAPGASIKLDIGADGLLSRRNCSQETSGARRVPSQGDRLYVKVLRMNDKKKLVLSTVGLDPAADQALARTQSEVAPPTNGAPAPAAARVWGEDDRKVLAALRNGGKKHGLSLDRLKKAALRYGLTISSKTNIVPLKKALEDAEPASSSSDDDDGIVPGARVMTPTHGAGVVLEGLSGQGRPRVRLDVPYKGNGRDSSVFKTELAVPKAQLTRLAPGDAGYEAPSSTTSAAGPGAAGSGAAAAFNLKVARVLGSPAEHELGFKAESEVVARRAASTLVVPRPLMALRDADAALEHAAEDARRALQEHKSSLDSLKEKLDQREAEAELIARRDLDGKEAHVKAARDAYEAEAAKSQQLEDAFAEASRALDAARILFCPALDALIKNAVDPLRADEEEQAALRRRVALQLEHSDSDAAKKLGKLIHPRNFSVLWDEAEHDGTPPRGVLALQCPRGNCRARYWFPFKEIHDDVMRNNQKSLACKKEGCGFRMSISRGDFGDRRAREGDMDDELERWGVDYA